MITQENENYLRFILLLMEGGKMVILELLDREVNKANGDIDSLLKRYEHNLKQAVKPPKQYDRLFPRSGKTDMNSWDIGLSVIVLDSVFKETLDKLLICPLKQIRQLRNTIQAHASSASISNDDYSDSMLLLENALNFISQSISSELNNRVKGVISRCRNDPLDNKSTLDNVRTLLDRDDMLQKFSCQIVHEINDAEHRITEHVTEELNAAGGMICDTVRDSEAEIHTAITRSDIEIGRALDEIQETVAKSADETHTSLAGILDKVSKVLAIVQGTDKTHKVIFVIEKKLTFNSSNEAAAQQAEDIVLEVTKKVINREDQCETMEKGLSCIEATIRKILSNIQKHETVIVKVKHKCIILTVQCVSYAGVLHLFNYSSSEQFHQDLDALSVLLTNYFETKINIQATIREESFQVIVQESSNTESESDEKQLVMSARCQSLEDVKRIVDLYTNGDETNNLNQLSADLSDYVTHQISITASWNRILVVTSLSAIDDKSVFGTDDKIVLGKLHAAMAEGHALKGVPMDKNLADISNCIGSGWESLAACLNVPYTEVSMDWYGLQEMFEPLVTAGKSFYGTDDKIELMLQHDLILYYRNKLSKLQLSPLFEEDWYAADFFDFYVKPDITILSHQWSKRQFESTPVTFHDIINYKPCQNIYISSPAGCGKTSFAKYLALIWCQAHMPVESYNQWILEEDINEMRTFVFFFIIFLRDEHERECDVDIMIQNQLLPNLANSTTYTDLGVKFFQSLLNNEKCIIILDGLDEWSHPAGDMCKLKNRHIPHSRARPHCTTLTTSQPWKLDVVKLKPEEIDQKLEIKSLEGVLFQSLIQNVVKILNKLHGKEMKAGDFKQELRNKKLTDLCKIPVVVMQLLNMWFDNESLGESQCEIYSNMIEFLLKRYCRKRKIVSEMEDIEVDDCSRYRQIPMCFQKNMYCKVHMELLSKLATLAYNTLFTDNEESSLVFDRRIAEKYLKTKEIEMSVAVGILTQEKVLGKSSIRQSHISFIHKTFQEYLAALYVALSPGTVKNVEGKIKDVCCSIEKILEMSQIFLFLSGLCPEVMVNLHEHLKQTVSEDSKTQRYRALLEPRVEWPREEQTLRRVQDAMVEWLDECWLNGHKHVTHLPVIDFFIRSSSQWSAELKSLAVHNPVCTLYVSGTFSPTYSPIYSSDYSPEEIEDILNSVTVFNSIQKLWLYGVSETFVVQLVSQHKHSWSARPEAWRQLGWVTLWRVKMSGNILCSLVDSILQLPKSVQVWLKFCSVSQGTGDWKAYIRSHPRLSVDEDVVVDEKLVWNVKLFQFHSNAVQTCSTM